MDLWKEFEMNERIGGMWNELGMSGGTAIIVLLVLYYIIKWAVKNGMIEAYKKISEKKMHDNLRENKTINNVGSNDDTSAKA